MDSGSSSKGYYSVQRPRNLISSSKYKTSGGDFRKSGSRRPRGSGIISNASTENYETVYNKSFNTSLNEDSNCWLHKIYYKGIGGYFEVLNRSNFSNTWILQSPENSVWYTIPCTKVIVNINKSDGSMCVFSASRSSNRTHFTNLMSGSYESGINSIFRVVGGPSCLSKLTIIKIEEEHIPSHLHYNRRENIFSPKQDFKIVEMSFRNTTNLSKGSLSATPRSVSVEKRDVSHASKGRKVPNIKKKSSEREKLAEQKVEDRVECWSTNSVGQTRRPCIFTFRVVGKFTPYDIAV